MFIHSFACKTIINDKSNIVMWNQHILSLTLQWYVIQVLNMYLNKSIWALTGKRGYNEFNSNVPLLLSIANVMYPIRVFDSVVRWCLTRVTAFGSLKIRKLSILHKNQMVIPLSWDIWTKSKYSVKIFVAAQWKSPKFLGWLVLLCSQMWLPPVVVATLN